jgi:hypothetical protein
MNDATRRAVAYVAARLAGQRDSNAVYDYAAGKHYFFSGTVQGGNVQVYDFDSRCHISGNPGSLYHFGNRSHLNIESQGGDFHGYDFASRRHFNGRVTGSSVSIYDHETNRHYNYAV